MYHQVHVAHWKWGGIWLDNGNSTIEDDDHDAEAVGWEEENAFSYISQIARSSGKFEIYGERSGATSASLG